MEKNEISMIIAIVVIIITLAILLISIFVGDSSSNEYLETTEVSEANIITNSKTNTTKRRKKVTSNDNKNNVDIELPVNMDMSKLYLDEKYGYAATIYNTMLDNLISHKYVGYEYFEELDGECKSEGGIDLTNMIMYSRENYGYHVRFYASFKNNVFKSYSYSEGRGTWEKDIDTLGIYKNGGDFFALFYVFGNDINEFNISYEEDVFINDHRCYKVIAYIMKDEEKDYEQTINFYIDVDTMQLVKKEVIWSYEPSNIKDSTFYYLYNYSDRMLEIPEEALQ